MKWIYEIGILGILVLITYRDRETGKIPNDLLLGLLVWGLLIPGIQQLLLYVQYGSVVCAWYGSGWSWGWNLLRSAVLGAAVPCLILLPLYLLKAIGAGDVKLLMLLSFCRRWPACCSFLWYCAVWAAVISCYTMVHRGILRERAEYFVHYVQHIHMTHTIEPYAERSGDTTGDLAVSMPILLGDLTWLILRGGIL